MGERPGALARGGALGFVGAAASAILGFATTMLISRLLGSDGAGVVMQATAVFAVVGALSKVGMDSTVIFLLPRLRLDSPERIKAHLRFMGGAAVGVSLLAAVVLNLLAGRIWGSAGGGLAEAIAAIAWFLPAQCLLLVSAAALRALGGMREYVLTQNLALPLLRPAAVVLACSAVASAFAVTLAWAAPIVVVLVGSLVVLFRKVRALPTSPRRLTDQERRLVLGFAAPRTLAAGLEQAIVWLDVLLVGALAGNAAAGIYGGAGRFIQAGMVVDTALRVVVSPQLSALVHQRRTAEVARLHTTATTWLVLFATPIYVLLAVFAPTLMLLLGPDFAPGAVVLVTLSLGAGVTFLAGNIHTLLIMSGHSGWAALNKVAVLVVNVVGNLVLVPRLGIVGAALTWAGCMVLDALLATLEVRRFLSISLGPAALLLPLALVAGTVAAPALLVALWLGQGLLPMLAAMGLCMVLFLGGCYLGRARLGLTGMLRR